MCGLFGLIFHEPATRLQYRAARHIFNQLALESEIRGRDATGIAVVQRTGDSHVAKLTYPAKVATRTNAFKGRLSMVGRNTAAILGHTRLGTHGANTEFNAHPIWFETRYGKLTGTHNGVLWNYSRMSPYPTKPYDSDTANLMARLSKEHENHWVTVLEQVQGSFALMIHRNDKLFMARNSGSPLHIATVHGLGATVYASTEQIIENALASLLLTAEHIVSVPLNKLYVLSTKDGTILEETRFRDAAIQGYWFDDMGMEWEGRIFTGA